MKVNENIVGNDNASTSERSNHFDNSDQASIFHNDKRSAPALVEDVTGKNDEVRPQSQSSKSSKHSSFPKTSSKPADRFNGFKIMFVLVVAVIFFGLGFVIGAQWEMRDNPTPEVTEEIVATKIEDCSELATSKLSYNGFVRYEQGNIPFINRKAFAMGYRADVRAGVDLSQAQVVVEGRDIKVKLPASTIQTIKIDPNSIEFYDNEYSLFAWDNKEDTVKALNAAQTDVETKMNRAELLNKADEQAKEVIEDMLKELTFGQDGYNIEVTVTERPKA